MMKFAKVTNIYSSTSCNALQNSCDWSRNGSVAFAANNSLCFFKPKESSKIFETKVSHTGKINCVKWIYSQNEDENDLYVITTSVDKTIIIWKNNNDQYDVYRKIFGHEGSVVNANVLLNNGNFLICSISVDLSLRIWRTYSSADEFEQVQVIKYNDHAITALALTFVQNKELLIFSTDDSQIHFSIFINNKFVEVLSIHGHDDWIKTMDVIHTDNDCLFLATGSQDHFIKIWKIWKTSDKKDQKLKLSSNRFIIKNSIDQEHEYSVSLESVLLGHDNWVHSVKWMNKILKEGRWQQPLGLLSASMDKSVILWQQIVDDGAWMESVRLGEVGGGNLGFYGALFGPNNLGILAHGFHGSFHLWWPTKNETMMKPGIVCGGHFNSVNDIVWNAEGEFLLSCSSDQSTRLHALHDNGQQCTWNEIARPQIHGYDMQCLAIIKRFSFASGADEKIVRIFDAPKNFLQNFSRICKKDIMNVNDAPEGACVPALGLSNKAVFLDSIESDEKIKNPYSDNYFVPQTLIAPPTEEDLLQNTLWPEVQKLYGHGYEIYSIAVNKSGNILASSCKATKYDHAYIILWSVGDWKILEKLFFHTLTITQISFSHNDQCLLSVSRDRAWCVFKHQDSKYKQSIFSGKKSSLHARIIWSCAWSSDDKFFITASRDKKAIVWNYLEEYNDLLEPLEIIETKYKILILSDSATAVDFSQCLLNDDKYLVAVGLASGIIELFIFNPNQLDSWISLCTISNDIAHHATIKRLRFRPKCEDSEHYLASCSEDTFVKILQIIIT